MDPTVVVGPKVAGQLVVRPSDTDGKPRQRKDANRNSQISIVFIGNQPDHRGETGSTNPVLQKESKNE